MTREQALKKIAAILSYHYPVPVYKCDCMPLIKEGPLKGTGQVLEGTWSDHVANIIMEEVTGF